MRTQAFYIPFHVDVFSPCYTKTQYRELRVLASKYSLLLVKNYVSKQVIEPKLVWEEKIVRALVLWSATVEQLGHKIWGVGRVRVEYKSLARFSIWKSGSFSKDFVSLSQNIGIFNKLGE